jgi:hypothetical protein
MFIGVQKICLVPFIITTSSTKCSSQKTTCPSQQRYKQVEIIIILTLEKSEESKLLLHCRQVCVVM